MKQLKLKRMYIHPLLLALALYLAGAFIEANLDLRQWEEGIRIMIGLIWLSLISFGITVKFLGEVLK